LLRQKRPIRDSSVAPRNKKSYSSVCLRPDLIRPRRRREHLVRPRPDDSPLFTHAAAAAGPPLRSPPNCAKTGSAAHEGSGGVVASSGSCNLLAIGSNLPTPRSRGASGQQPEMWPRARRAQSSLHAGRRVAGVREIKQECQRRPGQRRRSRILLGGVQVVSLLLEASAIFCSTAHPVARWARHVQRATSGSTTSWTMAT
jgi:hypothetical protein